MIFILLILFNSNGFLFVCHEAILHISKNYAEKQFSRVYFDFIYIFSADTIKNCFLSFLSLYLKRFNIYTYNNNIRVQNI